jgi:hypothetical protein
MSKKIPKAVIDRIEEYKLSPFPFIADMWNLTPQPIKPEFKERFNVYYEDKRYNDITKDFFKPFIEGRHLTWQQFLIIKAIENAVQGKGKRRISVRSGHGIGKTTTMSWMLLWYLFCHFEAQIPVTAPSQTQMYDALWKEVYKQLKKMPAPAQNLYEWQSSYIRMVERPQSWYARAKTARKEAPEALAGIHADHVLMLIDEASGVHEEIFNTAEGALTEKSILVIMISNPTRNVGYFYESQLGADRDAWEKFSFSTLDSPRITQEFEDRIIKKHGKGSDEYKIRVLGEFPDIEQVDDEGYSPLLSKNDLTFIDKPAENKNSTIWVGTPIMGIDPAGEGVDTTDWVIRDSFKAKHILSEKTSTPKSIANITRTLMGIHGVKPENIYIDSFGEGIKAAVELAKDGKDINAVNVGDQCDEDEDKNLYLNKRANIYMWAKKWLRSGGELVRSNKWEEILSIKFRRNERSRIQIMSKVKMKKLGYKSPNTADAFSLTFYNDDGSEQVAIKTTLPSQRENNYNRKQNQTESFEPFSAI